MKVFKKILVLVALCLIVAFFVIKVTAQNDKKQVYKLNTSNYGKLEEFRVFFNENGYELDVSNIDLDEVDADPITVVVHKASQLAENTLVEDTSLDVDGADIGVNIRWLIDGLNKYLGKKAIWTVLLAYRSGEEVYVFRGEVQGKIVRPTSEGGFGFDPYFLPDGSNKTLAEDKSEQFNARAKAVKALVDKQIFAIRPVIVEWHGEWQQHD